MTKISVLSTLVNEEAFMTVLDIFYAFGESVNIKLVDDNGAEFARYDGKDSIPSEYNDMKVVRGTILWDEKFLELTVKKGV